MGRDINGIFFFSRQDQFFSTFNTAHSLQDLKAFPEFCLLDKTQSMLLTVFFRHFKLPKRPTSEMYPKPLLTSAIVLFHTFTPCIPGADLFSLVLSRSHDWSSQGRR